MLSQKWNYIPSFPLWRISRIFFLINFPSSIQPVSSFSPHLSQTINFPFWNHWFFQQHPYKEISRRTRWRRRRKYFFLHLHFLISVSWILIRELCVCRRTRRIRNCWWRSLNYISLGIIHAARAIQAIFTVIFFDISSERGRGERSETIWSILDRHKISKTPPHSFLVRTVKVIFLMSMSYVI